MALKRKKKKGNKVLGGALINSAEELSFKGAQFQFGCWLQCLFPWACNSISESLSQKKISHKFRKSCILMFVHHLIVCIRVKTGGVPIVAQQ